LFSGLSFSGSDSSTGTAIAVPSDFPTSFPSGFPTSFPTTFPTSGTDTAGGFVDGAAPVVTPTATPSPTSSDDPGDSGLSSIGSFGIDVTIDFTAFNVPLHVVAPPADQVGPAKDDASFSN
jgi:hypothetical protein